MTSRQACASWRALVIADAPGDRREVSVMNLLGSPAIAVAIRRVLRSCAHSSQFQDLHRSGTATPPLRCSQISDLVLQNTACQPPAVRRSLRVARDLGAV